MQNCIDIRYAEAHNSFHRSKTQRWVSGSAVTTEFLQQARLGKHKAPAGGSGIEKIVGAKASSALPLDGIRQRERDRAKEGNDRLPMHLEVHTLGLSTGVRRDLYRQEKKPKQRYANRSGQSGTGLQPRAETRAH